MNKQEFITAIAAKTDFTKKDIKQVVEAIDDILLDEIAAGNKVKGFAGITFDGVDKPDRNGVNPQTGEKIVIPAHRAPKCTFTKSFKDLVAGK